MKSRSAVYSNPSRVFPLREGRITRRSAAACCTTDEYRAQAGEAMGECEFYSAAPCAASERALRTERQIAAHAHR